MWRLAYDCDPEAAMDIDVEKLKAFAEVTIRNFKALESQLIAYRMVFLSLKKLEPFEYEKLNRAFDIFINSQNLQAQMHEKYDEPLEALLKKFSEARPDQDPLQWFRDWKPEGPRN
jgi:hypothetical protein